LDQFVEVNLSKNYGGPCAHSLPIPKSGRELPTQLYAYVIV